MLRPNLLYLPSFSGVEMDSTASFFGRFQRLTLVGLTSVVLATAATATAGDKVDDFTLLDQDGNAHSLKYYADSAAIVLMVQGNGCPMVRNLLPDLRKVRADFKDQPVTFLMINANLQDDRDSLKKEAREWDIGLPVLHDDTQTIVAALGVSRTAETFVIDTKTWEVAYHGPINDRVTYERQKEKAQAHYLADAINGVLAGKPLAVTSRDTMGCLINFDKPAVADYAGHIVPILQKRCVECHRDGGLGPWAMSSYEMVKGFSPMMREVLRTRRMPPWHADPHVGKWQNDVGLSTAERRDLITWIEAGSPRGEGKDPLKKKRVAPGDWPMGEPDLVLTIAPQDVPASGIIDYRFPTIANPIKAGTWIRALAVNPGVTEVVHHVLVGITPPGKDPNNSQESLFDDYVGGYAPGTGPTEMPEGTGVYLEPGTHFLVQIHYTPFGRAVTDETRLGFYFHDEKPANFLRHNVVMNPMISIPAGAERHKEQAYFEFYKDATLYEILPHSHYRGRSSTFALRYPDGPEELLLSVPEYDFNWQRGYVFDEPLAVPAGARLVHTTVYDNSAKNPANPDPDRHVPWGLQSRDEMLYGDFVFTWNEETSDAPIHDLVRMSMTQRMGFLDKNMDGVLAGDEISVIKSLQRMLEFGDRNRDGALGLEEMIAVRKAMIQRRASAGAE